MLRFQVYRAEQKSWFQVARKVQPDYSQPWPAMPGWCLTKQSLFYGQHCTGLGKYESARSRELHADISEWLSCIGHRQMWACNSQNPAGISLPRPACILAHANCGQPWQAWKRPPPLQPTNQLPATVCDGLEACT